MLQQQMKLRFVLHNIVARTATQNCPLIVHVSWIVPAIRTDVCAVVRYDTFLQICSSHRRSLNDLQAVEALLLSASAVLDFFIQIKLYLQPSQ